MEGNVFHCKIEATVVTGLEFCAKEEVKEKIDVECSFDRGKINFEIPVCDVTKVLSDNNYNLKV